MGYIAVKNSFACFNFFFFLFLFNSAIKATLIKQQALFGFKLLLDTDQAAQTSTQTEVQPEPMQSGQFQRCILWISDLK